MSSSTKTNFGLKAALSLSVGLGALMAGGITASAQDEGDTTKRLNTVTTTATKREQTLQDVPIAVSVVDNVVIEQANIVDILDLQTLVPSLRVGQLQQAGNATFSIRGFGNGANNVGIEPAVAVFIDGVYRTRAAGGLSDYADIERIEVLRGPQSTLFGKNASVGLISVITSAPEFEFGGKAEVTLGNYNSQIFKGRVTGPLTDNVAFALSGSLNSRDGYAENVALGTELNDRDRYSIKGQLLIEPSEDLSIRLIADYDSLDETCCYSPNITSGPTEAAITAVGGQVITDPFGFETALDVDPTNEIQNSGISAQADWDVGPGTLTSITAFRNQELLADGDVDFTSLTAIQSNVLDYTIDTFTQEVRYAGSTDNIDYLFGAFYFDESVDLQGNVLYDSGFYNYGNALASQALGAPNALPGIEALLGYAPLTFFAPGTGSRENFQQDNKSYSLFTQFDFHLTDKLTATLGLAYINDEKTVSGTVQNDDLFSSLDLPSDLNQQFIVEALLGASLGDITLAQVAGGAVPGVDLPTYLGLLGGTDPVSIGTVAAIQAGVQAGVAQQIGGGLAPLQFLPGFVDFPNAIEGDTTEDDSVTYTARLVYDVNDVVNIYGSYATGFKASSWNLTRDSSFLLSNQAGLAGANLIPNNRGDGTRFAAPEETSVWELGAKLSTGDFNLNLAFFDQTVENFQSTIFQGTGFVLSNAGKQSTRGIEWDATWLVTDELTLTFAGIQQDPKYDSFVGAPVPWVFNEALGFYTQSNATSVDASGAMPAGIPETSMTFAAAYNFDLTDSMSGFVRGDYQYESEVQVVDNVVGLDREVGVLNASVGFSWDNGLDLSVWGRNLNEDEYFQSAFPTVAQNGSVNGYTNAPRTYGVTVRKTF